MRAPKLWAVTCIAVLAMGAGDGWDGDLLFPVPVFCVQTGSHFTLDKGDGIAIGDELSQSQCEASAANAREGVVCAGFGGVWFATRVSPAKKFGNGASFDDCQAAVADAKADMVCTLTETGTRPWRPTHARTGFAYGRYGTSLADCVLLTRNASPGVICTNTGTFNFQGRKPTVVNEKAWTDANLLGASGQQAYCTKSTREARNNKVCACNGEFCAATDWISYDVASRKAVGNTSSLDSCIQSQ
jgi:hypothetical protein